MTSSQDNIAHLLKEATMYLVEKTGQERKWGTDYTNNQGLYLDLQHAFDRFQEKLHLLRMEVTEQVARE